MAQKRPQGKRSSPSKKKNNKVIIIVEGKTEEEYFKAYKEKDRLYTVRVMKNRTRTSPLQIVEALVEQKEKEEDGPRSKFVAVFDHRKEKDSNTDDDIYHKAIKLCQEKKFIAITSKPSFEFWFLLHFTETDRSMSAEEAEKELKEYYRRCLSKEYKKGGQGTFQDTVRYREDAIKRAARIWQKKERAKGSYTNVHELIEELAVFNGCGGGI